jgi:hypothetical protein
MVFMGAGGAYMVKFMRYRSRIWKGRGMIRRDMDSGAKQAARIYLGRSRPSFWLSPLSHFFLKWTFKVGEICMNTGSVSVYNVFVSNLVGEEKQCRSIGTNDRIRGKAAEHIRGLDKPSCDVGKTIDGLLASGLKIDGCVRKG